MCDLQYNQQYYNVSIVMMIIICMKTRPDIELSDCTYDAAYLYDEWLINKVSLTSLEWLSKSLIVAPLTTHAS